MREGRSHLPHGERLAIVEQENSQIKEALLEIKDAVVGIRSAFERLAAVEERMVSLREKQGRTERWLEGEVKARQAGDDATRAQMSGHMNATVALRESVASLASTVEQLANDRTDHRTMRDMVMANTTLRRLLLMLLPALITGSVAVLVTAWKLGAFN